MNTECDNGILCYSAVEVLKNCTATVFRLKEKVIKPGSKKYALLPP
jgi:hypothetical protein